MFEGDILLQIINVCKGVLLSLKVLPLRTVVVTGNMAIVVHGEFSLADI